MWDSKYSAAVIYIAQFHSTVVLCMTAFSCADDFMRRQQEWAPMIEDQLDPDVDTIVLCHHGMRRCVSCRVLAGGSNPI